MGSPKDPRDGIVSGCNQSSTQWGCISITGPGPTWGGTDSRVSEVGIERAPPAGASSVCLKPRESLKENKAVEGGSK